MWIMDKCGLMKLKRLSSKENSWLSDETANRIGKKHFASFISARGLISRLYKEHTKQQYIKQCNQ